MSCCKSVLLSSIHSRRVLHPTPRALVLQACRNRLVRALLVHQHSRCAASGWACGPVTIPARSIFPPEQLQSARHTRTHTRATLCFSLSAFSWSLRRPRRADELWSACSCSLVECAGATRRGRIREAVPRQPVRLCGDDKSAHALACSLSLLVCMLLCV